jgi:hypothetical protein
VHFAKYTGETSEAAREKIRLNPPQILLTNYVMAELLLVRPEDQRFLEQIANGERQSKVEATLPPAIRHAPFADRGLRFLVFDELHTYRGRQGADVAMLVRRLKERCAGDGLLHIGTSATMISRPDATAEERRQSVADFAKRFFGHHFGPEHVIEETLAPFTEGGPPTAEELKAAVGTPLPGDMSALRGHPLMRWLEYELGIEQSPDGTLKRRTPRELSKVAEQLAALTGGDVQRCTDALRKLLAHASRLQRRAAPGHQRSSSISSSLRVGRSMPPWKHTKHGGFHLKGRYRPAKTSCFFQSNSAASAGRTITMPCSRKSGFCPIR